MFSIMKDKKWLLLCLCLLSAVFSIQSQNGVTKDMGVKPPSWFAHNVNVVKSGNTRFGPTKTDDLYLEYELMGRQGPFDFYGYVDLPKFFGTGSKHLNGFWDGNGTKLFADLQGRLSINSLFGRGENRGLLKEYFIAANYVGNYGRRKDFNSAHNVWLGLGTSVNTYSKLSLDVNFYLHKAFSDYGASDEYSMHGYRLKMKWMYPIATLFNKQGGLTYIGFGDYDFGSHKEPKVKPSNNIGSNDALQITNVLDLTYRRFHTAAVARYWHHGGGNKYNGGSFPVNTSGWGYYFMVGYKL